MLLASTQRLFYAGGGGEKSHMHEYILSYKYFIFLCGLVVGFFLKGLFLDIISSLEVLTRIVANEVFQRDT